MTTTVRTNENLDENPPNTRRYQIPEKRRRVDNPKRSSGEHFNIEFARAEFVR